MSNSSEEIWIDIPLSGEIVIEGKGFSGPDCKLATKEIEDALGVVTKTEKKPEYTRVKTNTKTVVR